MIKQSRWEYLSELDDVKLIELHRLGNRWAGDRLIIRHTPLVRCRVATMLGTLADADDAMQEGMLGLLSALVSYDPSKKAGFTTFAYRCITNRILNWRTNSSTGGKVDTKKQIRLDDLDEQLLADGGLDPQEIFINKESLDQWDETFSKMLTSLEKKVITLYYSGSSYVDISKTLGISAKAVDNALQRVRKKLSR